MQIRDKFIHIIEDTDRQTDTHTQFPAFFHGGSIFVGKLSVFFTLRTYKFLQPLAISRPKVPTIADVTTIFVSKRHLPYL